MCLFPLSGDHVASFPHVLESLWYPPVPNPILELQVTQSLSLLPRKLTNSCFRRTLFTTCSFEPFLVRVVLQGSLWLQSTSSTFLGPVKWRGIARQRSVSTETWPACWWLWSESDSQPSYQDRSWRWMCSSRSATWSLVRQTTISPSERLYSILSLKYDEL